MRKLLPIAAAIAAALTLTSLSPASAHKPSKGHDFTVTTKTIDQAQIDVGKPGPSLGDSNVITEDVYVGGKKVGTSDLTCTVVRLDAVKGVSGQLTVDEAGDGPAHLTFDLVR